MSPPVDLFGEIPPAAVQAPRGKHYTQPKGYAANPGTGPAGETCGSCNHLVRCGNYNGAKRWSKCELMEKVWTHGRGSDVLARMPACSRWEFAALANNPEGESDGVS